MRCGRKNYCTQRIQKLIRKFFPLYHRILHQRMSIKKWKNSPLISLLAICMHLGLKASLIHNTNKFTNDAYYRMANTSGLTVRDHQHSIDLCDAALVTALDLLRPKGSFVCKLFTGVEDKLFEKRVKMVFKKTIRFKPKSSRNESKEVYIIGMDKKEDIDKVEVFTT